MNLKCLSATERLRVHRRGVWVRTLLLIPALAGIAVLALVKAPQVRAQEAQPAAAPAPSFEVASIKPNRSGSMMVRIMGRPGALNASGITIRQLIANAYGVKDFQISGGPSWISSDRYDIDAKADDAEIETLRKLPPEQATQQMSLMLQGLLAERCKLQVTHTSKDLSVYALVVAKTGLKLQEAKPGDTYANGIKGPDGQPLGHGGMVRMGRGQLTGQGIPMRTLVMVLSQQLGRTVLDQTGLKGNYDVSLQWTPDPGSPGMMPGPPPGAGPAPDSPPPDTSGPSIFTAVQEQLGLKLDSTKGPVETIVIDDIERPSEN